MKNKKLLIGIVSGTAAGVIDVIPMIIQKLSWDANLSAFIFWIITGFIIASSNLKLPGIVKGILLALVLILPTAIIIYAQDPAALIPMSIATVVLGGALGLLIDKFGGTA